MKLYDLMTTTNEDSSRIVHVSGRISDQPSSEEQKETITFQFEIDLPTVRNGALLRAEVLDKVSEISRQLAVNYRTLSDSSLR